MSNHAAGKNLRGVSSPTLAQAPVRAQAQAQAPVQAQALGSESGFSVVELLIALTLMAFLSASLLTVISAGGAAFKNVLDVKTAQSEARIAISYITVKLRQNSSSGKVSIIPSDSMTNSRNVIKIDATNGDSAGDSYFIYFEESPYGGPGRLVEKSSGSPLVDDPKGAEKIAEIADFSVAYANDDMTAITVTVSCDAPNERITRDVTIVLRS